jgi:hypothetical protein
MSTRQTRKPPRCYHAQLPFFVDATNGIGELAMKAFVKHAAQSRVYFVARSLEAARGVTAECRALNPDGEYILMASDITLLAVRLSLFPLFQTVSFSPSPRHV